MKMNGSNLQQHIYILLLIHGVGKGEYWENLLHYLKALHYTAHNAESGAKNQGKMAKKREKQGKMAKKRKKNQGGGGVDFSS